MAKTITKRMEKRAVIDSNILVYSSKGRLDFYQLIESYDEIYISSITFMEAMGFNYTSFIERRAVEEFVKDCEVVHTDNAISHHVIAYRRKRKIELADAIILATAKKLKADLITIDAADFKNLDSSVKIIVPSLI